MAASRARPDDPALDSLMGKIEREHGLRLASYKQPCLRRRLAVRMRACGAHTFGAYAEVLDAVPAEYDRLLDALTVNVTRFFRNPETWALLGRRVVPELWARPGRVRVWSAGCASGEEPYSLALLFAEHAAAGEGVEAALARLRIDATDLDPEAVEVACRAEYPAAALAEVPPALLARWFSAEPPHRVASALARRVRVAVHDLTREPPPAPPYHLIVCRNAVIYFDRATQERIFAAFAEALVPGGRLLLGKVETLYGPARARFDLEEPRERLFRRR
ncbi:MAG: protein-glutamate O-methyltransferase CheR [Gemmatimonadales bacterium]|jgi:chemotaxis methyl-accepting protein methylase